MGFLKGFVVGVAAIIAVDRLFVAMQRLLHEPE
jgi:hypothetical protein